MTSHCRILINNLCSPMGQWENIPLPQWGDIPVPQWGDIPVPQYDPLLWTPKPQRVIVGYEDIFPLGYGDISPLGYGDISPLG